MQNRYKYILYNKTMNNVKYQIKMFKGYDKINNPFTAICLLSDKQYEELSNELNNDKINLTKYNIIYKQFGHILDKKIINDIKEYCDKNIFLTNSDE